MIAQAIGLDGNITGMGAAGRLDSIRKDRFRARGSDGHYLARVDNNRIGGVSHANRPAVRIHHPENVALVIQHEMQLLRRRQVVSRAAAIQICPRSSGL